MLDTGSQCTIITEEVYQKLPRLTPLQQACTQITGVTGNSIPVKGICVVEIAGTPTSSYVINAMDEPCILGINFLRAAGGVIDTPQKILHLSNGQKLNLNLDEQIRAFRANVSPRTATCLPKASQPVINKVIEAYKDIFAQKETPVREANLPEAHIDTGNTQPIRQKAYRLPFSKRKQVEECVNNMLTEGIIQPSSSPWSSPITLVPKKDGTTRFCVDYRQLNQVTRKDAHPLPNIQDVFDSMHGAKYFSTLDLKSGYWQLKMAASSIPKTAFTCHLGLYEFKRLPFGLTNAPAIFQREVSKALSGLLGKICLVYIDDIVVFSKTEHEHAQHLEQVFQRLRQVGLQVKASKCHFGQTEVELLGYLVSAQGISPLPSRVEVITKLEPPTTVKGVRSFLGLTGYYRQLIPRYAELSLPLSELTKKDHPFVWTPECQQSFEELKQALSREPLLTHPNPSKPYNLHTDASDYAIGAVLSQVDDYGQEKVVSYLSHKLSDTQRKWATIEKEAYAIIYALKKFHAYLHGSEFRIKTDHKPLKSLFQSEIRNTKLQRWAIQIGEYGAPIDYQPGRLNIAADMLSRVHSTTLSPLAEFDQMAPAGHVKLPEAQPLPSKQPPPYTLQHYPPLPSQQNHYKQPQTSQPTPPQMQQEEPEPPGVWQADGLSWPELRKLQREQFEQEALEADDATDETRYIIENGVLFTMAPPYPGAEIYPRVLLPQQFRQKVIDRCHHETAHSGAQKTLMRIQENYVWPGMRQHVRDYIGTCTHCRTLTPSNTQHPRGTLPTPPCPFHTWNIDLVGPFKRDRRGRQFLLTAVDYLTGWCEAIPISSKKSALVHEVIRTEIVARYGLPKVIITDNGGEFTSKEFEEWLRMQGIEHRKTSPYHAATNGKVERFNGSIQRILLKLTSGDPKKWSECLADALYAYRISAGPGNVSPYTAVYGKRPTLAREEDQSVSDRRSTQYRAVKLLQEYNDKKNKKYMDHEPTRARELEPGTFVSVRALNPRKGEPKWKPGFQVVSSYKGALRVLDLESGRTLRLNQRNVREIPQQKVYEEVDPLPQKKGRSQKRQTEDLPQQVKPLPTQPQHTIPPAAPAATTQLKADHTSRRHHNKCFKHNYSRQPHQLSSPKPSTRPSIASCISSTYWRTLDRNSDEWKGYLLKVSRVMC